MAPTLDTGTYTELTYHRGPRLIFPGLWLLSPPLDTSQTFLLVVHVYFWRVGQCWPGQRWTGVLGLLDEWRDDTDWWGGWVVDHYIEGHCCGWLYGPWHGQQLKIDRSHPVFSPCYWQHTHTDEHGVHTRSWRSLRGSCGLPHHEFEFLCIIIYTDHRWGRVGEN